MAFPVYLLCSLLSIGCAGALIRAYLGNRTRLLFWSGLCFAAIAINNILLSIDFQLGPNFDLSVVRALFAFFGMAVMVYGLIWDTV